MSQKAPLFLKLFNCKIVLKIEFQKLNKKKNQYFSFKF